MALPEIELRLAMSWRVREISYFQMVIEESRCANGLNDGERRRLRVFASAEINKLNLANDEEIVSSYFIYLLSIKNVAQMADFMEESVD